jgi:putative isomerase
MNTANFQKTRDHIRTIMPLITHAADGHFRHPYLSVTYGHTYGGYIYCWDNHHMSLRFAAAGEPEHMRYFADTLLSFQTSTGYTPCIVSAANGRSGLLGPFHAQPFLAQNVAIYTAVTRDMEWAASAFPKLKRYMSFWRDEHAGPLGLYRWRHPYMSGFDNEITGTLFQPDTILSPDLNAWLYLELRSMAHLAGLLQEVSAQEAYLSQAEALKQAINDHLWDERLGTYAAYDLCLGKCRVSLNEGGPAGDDSALPDAIGRYAFLSCPALIPLFAGLASQERAERMITRFILNPDHFRSPYGIRSLSKSSEYYNNAKWGNPPRFGDHRRLTNSNWQGPVWIPLNWFVFHSLLRHGFTAEAERLADDTFRVIAMNLDKFGFMRENFDGETGDGLYADKFASWNILADLMPDYLPGGKPSLPLFF